MAGFDVLTVNKVRRMRGTNSLAACELKVKASRVSKPSIWSMA